MALLTLGGVAVFERQSLIRELNTQSAALHSLASQRADQHDAHLTSLSAVFVAGGVERQDLMLDVAATITRFYPRIISVNVVPFAADEALTETLSSLAADDSALVRQLAQRSTGALEIQQMPTRSDSYLVVKRSPNTDAARHGIALVIDADALLETDAAFWQQPSVSQRLVTPQGDILTGSLFGATPLFSQRLGSASQPLILETALTIRVADVLPIGKAMTAIFLVSLAFGLIVFGMMQQTRTRDAEGRATLSAQETQLAHASRVNAMGEMASGMAHELAQPLTAILSQAQAGRHLAKRGDVDRLSTVLDDTVAQAQRAADILDRLRRWSKPNRAEVKACSLNEAAQSVARLLTLEAKTSGAVITLASQEAAIFIEADPVELEQVVFNLVRNALDAVQGAKVKIKTRLSGDRAILEVSDNGPGVSEELKPHIFEPFVTGKPNGTGLGLALCQRLVEEMDGDIALLPDATQTTFRLSFPHGAAKDAA